MLRRRVEQVLDRVDLVALINRHRATQLSNESVARVLPLFQQ
jgi:hypothetical protein